jgi:deazaflavin-dependent oxidoreductase (nitroreductase family)
MALDADRIFSRLNPLIRAWLRTPVLQQLLSPGLILLTITGRKTGRTYSIPVGYQRDGDTLYVMVSKARRKQWWRNYVEPGRIEVRLRGHDIGGQAVVVPPGSDEFRKHTEAQLRRLPSLDRVFGIRFDRERGLDSDQLLHLGHEMALVQIDLDSGQTTI